MSKKLKNPAKLKKPLLQEINFSTQKVVSYSQYSNYAQCAHKWYLTSVEKKKSPPNIHMVFGTSMHFVLQEYLKQVYAISGTAADKMDWIDIFENKFQEEYKLQYAQNNHIHFSSAEEMEEFYDDGVAIIEWFRKHRKEYFTTRNCYLIGCEIPLQVEVKKNILFVGYIDLVLYDVDLDKIIIYDFKTSTKGWNKWNKADDTKLSQILMYKKYFSELYEFPIEKIGVEFLILKRKAIADEWHEFPKRIQVVRPVDGKIKIKKAISNFTEFLDNSFDDEGKPLIKEHIKNISKLCNYCIFNNTPDCIK